MAPCFWGARHGGFLELLLTEGQSVVHDFWAEAIQSQRFCGCSSVVEHLLAKERVESSNLFIRLFDLAIVKLDSF